MWPERITVCGGGNAAHVLIAMLENSAVSVYVPFADEAERLRAGCRRAGGVTARAGETVWRGEPQTISDDPAKVFPDANLVLLALPASAHGVTLAAATPYLRSGAWVVALPARGGFDWEAAALLPEGVVLAGLQTLPWACRIVPGKYGEAVEILGTKKVVDLASRPATVSTELAATLSQLFHISLQPVSSFLALTLANTGQIIHPGIMHGMFHNWDGKLPGEDQAPLFYAGVTPEIAAQLQAMSDEIQAVRTALIAARPDLDLTAVLPLDAWLRRSYGSDIADSASLRTCFTTNRAYASLRAPMKLNHDGKTLVPSFEARYLTEDVPFGLLVTRGIAELCNVSTPAIDRVIEWAQTALSREWLEHDRLRGRDLANSRIPQRFGIRELSELVS
ncbi:MAG: NAD/NADP octopine/nopaline dehydrogenase family protein [Anaerolineales bacterium]